MSIGRRELILGTLGLGVTLAAGPRMSLARRADIPQAASTFGVVPRDGIDQTAALQDAIDAAAQSGKALFLPAGTYTTRRLELRSGTSVVGVPNQSILTYGGGGTLLSIESATNVKLSGLTLDGGAKDLGDGSSLLAAKSVQELDLSSCRFLASSGDGIVLRKVSGRITRCEIKDIKKRGLFSEDACNLNIASNHIHDCGDNGIQIWCTEPREDGTIVNAERIAAGSTVDGVVIANNLVDKAATGISVATFGQGHRLAVIRGNLIRNLFFRKGVDSRGTGVAVEADCVVSANVVEGAPAFGILISRGRNRRDVSVTDNLIRNSRMGIGVPASPSAGHMLITDNLITGAKEGAIRAMDGPKLIGPDLSHASTDTYRTLSIRANVTR